MSAVRLITGGAGFIGSGLARQLIAEGDAEVVVVDKLTYAGHLESLEPVKDNARFHFEQTDICDGGALADIFARYRPDAVFHLAAESHVDRSIDTPAAFIQTNINGTYRLLETVRSFLSEGAGRKIRAEFRFLHVSTDEVFGSLGPKGAFSESSPYAPNSPYAASKASADHLARAWQKTYGLPVLITNCSNNYGPYQFPEKLIPLMITRALAGGSLPVYGDGQHVRDWLYVEDHCRALRLVLEQGRLGETYNIGGAAEMTNLALVQTLCRILDEERPKAGGGSYASQIAFVEDRPGHDRRYAIDCTKLVRELGWQQRESFETGLRKTVRWYLENGAWCASVLKKARYAGERLGRAR